MSYKKIDSIKPNHTIDIAKFVASLMILSLHTKPFNGTEFNYYLNCLLVSGVPFFFCVSSYFFFNKGGRNIGKYIRRYYNCI